MVHVATHERDIRSESELEARAAAYHEKLAQVTEHNRRYLAGDATFGQGVNAMSDLLPHERVGATKAKANANGYV